MISIATIKDVARLAGVSASTVSNIINGKASVKSDSVKRVREAMEALGYQPDANARGLRSSRNQAIAFICPTLESACYRAIYDGICTYAAKSDLPVRLYLTHSFQDREKRILEEVNKERLAAAIIISCIPRQEQHFLSLLNQKIQLMFLLRQPEHLPYTYFSSLAFEPIGSRIAGSLPSADRITLVLGKSDYSCEQELRRGLCGSLGDARITVYHLEESSETAYKHAALWMQSGTVPDLILCSNDIFAEGVMAAANLFAFWKRPRIFTLCPKQWLSLSGKSEPEQIQLDYFGLGYSSVRKLLQVLRNPSGQDLDPLILEDLPQMNSLPARSPLPSQVSPQPIRVMMIRGAASYAARMFAAKYTHLTGVPVDIDIFPYDELCSRQAEDADNYDILQVNASSLPQCVSAGLLQRLEADTVLPYLERNFQREIISNYCEDHGSLYAVPYMFDAQILVYRKDLFTDSRLKRLFFETRRTELQVPQTFREMDMAAEFFTRTFNSESPVPYGITLGGSPLYSVYEWMPRFLEKGGKLLDRQGRFDLRIAEETLAEYAANFRFADSAAVDWDFSQQAQAFGEGQAAMMMLYQAHLSDHRQHFSFEVDDTIGFTPISYPIRGGWSLGVSRSCTRTDAAMQFITWLCSNENSIPYNVLGGSLPCRSTFSSASYMSSHPWMKTAITSMRQSRPMVVHAPFHQWQFEQAAGPLVHLCITGELAPEDAARQIAGEIRRLSEK